jgi:hypothetical protein
MDREPAGLGRALWLFPLAMLLHNTEEAIWLPAWSARTIFHPVVGALEFRFALIVITVLAFVITALAQLRGGIWPLVTLGYAGAMLLNVLFPHVLASVFERGYTPGVVTALLCNLPVDAYLLRRALRQRLATPRALALAVAVVAATLVVAIPLLFAAGRLLTRLET